MMLALAPGLTMRVVLSLAPMLAGCLRSAAQYLWESGPRRTQ